MLCAAALTSACAEDASTSAPPVGAPTDNQQNPATPGNPDPSNPDPSNPDAPPATGDSGVVDPGNPDTPAPVIDEEPVDMGACSVMSNPVTAMGVAGDTMTFEQRTISEQGGAAFLHPEDLDGDGFPEFMLTSLTESGFGLRFPPIQYGGAYILKRDGGAPQGDLGSWSTEAAFTSSAQIDWPNESTYFDVDNDGVRDWVIGAGFIPVPNGKIVWMKGQEQGGKVTFGEPNEIAAVPNDADYYYHVAAPVDMDGDGDVDFVTTSHKGVVGDTTSRLEWYENDGLSGTASFKYHLIAETTGGALIELHDIDGDGDKDIFVPQFFHSESLVWFENSQGNGSAWDKHVVDDSTGRGFIVKLVDMNGDGRKDVVYGNHNHQLASDPDDQVMGLYWWEIPAADEVRGLSDWMDYKHVIYEGFNVPTDTPDQSSAPGMINVGDIDRDGDLDITVSGDGDPGLYVLQQQADGFELLMLDTGHENSGSQVIVDLDGDCDLDILWAVYGPASMTGTPTSKVFAFLQQ